MAAIELGKTAVCTTCWIPYLIADGHNCPGPRASLVPASAPETETARLR